MTARRSNVPLRWQVGDRAQLPDGRVGRIVKMWRGLWTDRLRAEIDMGEDRRAVVYVAELDLPPLPEEGS